MYYSPRFAPAQSFHRIANLKARSEASRPLIQKQLRSSVPIDQFANSLKIGTVDDGGTFTAATETTEYTVGTEVHIKLAHDTTDFGFALFDCSAGGVALFQDYCPTTEAKNLFNAAFISHEEFKLNIFQSGNLDTVIFNCNLRIYAAAADEPADCTARLSPTVKDGVEHKDAEVVAVATISARKGSNAESN